MPRKSEKLNIEENLEEKNLEEKNLEEKNLEEKNLEEKKLQEKHIKEQIEKENELKKKDIDDLFEDLQAILKKLEDKETSLEDGFKLYANGILIVKVLNDKLEKKEKQLQVIETKED